MNISLRFPDFWRIKIKKKYFFFFSDFILKLDKPFSDFNNIFFNSSDLNFGIKKFFLQFLIWYFSPWIQIRGSVYFCGSNVADPTNPNPIQDLKHCILVIKVTVVYWVYPWNSRFSSSPSPSTRFIRFSGLYRERLEH